MSLTEFDGQVHFFWFESKKPFRGDFDPNFKTVNLTHLLPMHHPFSTP